MKNGVYRALVLRQALVILLGRIDDARQVTVVLQVGKLHALADGIARRPPHEIIIGLTESQGDGIDRIDNRIRKAFVSEIPERRAAVLDNVVENRGHPLLGGLHFEHHAKGMEDIGRTGLSTFPAWASAAIAIAFSSVLMGHPSPWVQSVKVQDIDDSVKGMSGNGYHLRCRMPEMDPEEGKALVRKCLAALKSRLDVDNVEVDQKVYNPSRVWKVYATTARKGDHTPDRPHRKSFLFKKTPESLDQAPMAPPLGYNRLALSSSMDPKPAPVDYPWRALLPDLPTAGELSFGFFSDGAGIETTVGGRGVNFLYPL